ARRQQVGRGGTAALLTGQGLRHGERVGRAHLRVGEGGAAGFLALRPDIADGGQQRRHLDRLAQDALRGQAVGRHRVARPGEGGGAAAGEPGQQRQPGGARQAVATPLAENGADRVAGHAPLLSCQREDGPRP
ncbi:hypothetical protein HMPREF0731_2906, partial [Pseudoroseomonas cervicalis ATCC 49957]